MSRLLLVKEHYNGQYFPYARSTMEINNEKKRTPTENNINLSSLKTYFQI